MKTIELTKEHKSKLLEMCKKLFPDYYRFDIEIEKDYDGNQGFISFLDKKLDENTGYIYIHWFEFCCKKLAFQIYNFNIGKTKTTYSTFVGECVITSTFHPIDYLYNELKKLK